MIKAILRDAIAGILALAEDDVTTLATQACQNEISRTDNRLDAMLQDLVNKAIADKLRPVEFENRLLRTIGDVISSPWYLTKNERGRVEQARPSCPGGDNFEEENREGCRRQSKKR